jgi:hypothetical protein
MRLSDRIAARRVHVLFSGGCFVAHFASTRSVLQFADRPEVSCCHVNQQSQRVVSARQRDVGVAGAGLHASTSSSKATRTTSPPRLSASRRSARDQDARHGYCSICKQVARVAPGQFCVVQQRGERTHAPDRWSTASGVGVGVLRAGDARLRLAVRRSSVSIGQRFPVG